MIQAYVTLSLRLPKALWEFVKDDAERENRSINGHVKALIKERKRAVESAGEAHKAAPHGQ